MNFYPHHIGDYLTATAHLSWVEDCAYRRLLDLYYSREQAIPADLAQAARLCRATTKDERRAVESVLAEFFTLTDKGWAHTRCEEEIAKAAEAAKRARQNGKRGGRPPKEKPTDNPEKTQPVSGGNPEESKSKAPNPNPITNPINTPKPPSGADRLFETFWSTYPRKVGKDAARKAFEKRRPDDELLGQMLTAIRRQVLSPAWVKDGGQFIPHPSTWLNEGRWQDEDLLPVGGEDDWTGSAQ